MASALRRPASPREQSLPRWARTLDGLSLVTVVLLCSAATFGGVRTHAFGVTLTATSFSRLLLVLTVLVGVRHLLFRRPTLLERLLHAIAALRQSATIRDVVPVFVLSRSVVLGAGMLGILLVGFPPDLSTFRTSDHDFINLPARWDAGWYLWIAEDGYEPHSDLSSQQTGAFFPAFPMLMRSGGALLGSGTLRSYVPGINTQHTAESRFIWGGVLAALAAFFFALGYLYRLARDECGEHVARGSIALLAAYPFALFFSAAYTESLFLLGNVAAFYHLRRGDHVAAGAWGVLVGLTKPNGILLSVPLFLLWLGQGGVSPLAPRLRALMVVGMPAVGTAVFSVYVWGLFGDPLAWVWIQQGGWNRGFDEVGVLLADRIQYVSERGWYAYAQRRPVELLNGLASLFALVLTVPVARRLGLAYASFVVVMVLPPLLAGGLLSMGRFTSVFFPLFIYLAAVLPRRWTMYLVCVWGPLQALASVAFHTWRPLY